MLKDVAKVGQKGDIATVSEGYAINFLIPRGFARAATAGAKKEIELHKGKKSAARDAAAKKVAEGIQAVDGKSVTIRAKANDEGHLFATLHADHVGEAVFNQLGVCLPDTAFDDIAIKELGAFDVPVEGEGVKGTIKTLVEREG